MSKSPPQQNNTNDEVDLGQLFNLIGKALSKVYNFFASIFNAIFSVIIYSIKAVIVNFKIIAITLSVAIILGFGLEKVKPDNYESTMLVKTYYDSKYQLVDNINYYNSLIAEGDFASLSEIFEVEEDILKDVVGIEIEIKLFLY